MAVCTCLAQVGADWNIGWEFVRMSDQIGYTHVVRWYAGASIRAVRMADSVHIYNYIVSLTDRAPVPDQYNNIHLQ
jgi:hypothetical protein